MNIRYTGSIHRLQGGGMAFGHYDTTIENLEANLGKQISMTPPDTKFEALEVFEGGVRFAVYFYDKRDEFVIHWGETVQYKKEQNAFGFCLDFTLC